MLKWAGQAAGLTEVPHLDLTRVPCECVSGRDPRYRFMI